MTSNGTMPNSSKKRKASELESDFSNKTSTSKSRPRQKAARSNHKASDDIPFTYECPYRPSGKTHEDVFVQREAVDPDYAPDFKFEYAVRPGRQWEDMRSYRNVKLQDHTFSVGAIIYINRQNPPPKSPRPDATDAEILKYDRANFWVARIADTRAESDKAVFLRVYWLYWPEELPMGRQPYHGECELIQSNAMDIVDAQTISGAADLTFWDETEPNHQYRERFWRQTLDISKLKKGTEEGLSELRKHCKCRQPHNPDRTMYQCKKPSCMTWNHEECLVDDLLKKAWPAYEADGTLEHLKVPAGRAAGRQGEDSLRQRLLSPVRHLGKIVQDTIQPSVDVILEQSAAHTTASNAKGDVPQHKKEKPQKKTVKSQTTVSHPWDGKLKANIMATAEAEDDSPILCRIEETSVKKAKTEPKSWQIQAHCLVCGQGM